MFGDFSWKLKVKENCPVTVDETVNGYFLHKMLLMQQTIVCRPAPIKMTGGTPEVRSDKRLTLMTFNIRYSTMDQWTNGPMDQWTNGLMD